MKRLLSPLCGAVGRTVAHKRASFLNGSGVLLMSVFGAIVLGMPCARAADVAAPMLQRVPMGGIAANLTSQYLFTLYANHALADDLSAITQVIFIQHGVNRNGQSYLKTGTDLIRSLGVDPAKTLVIAPQFFNLRDLGHDAELVDTLVWQGDQWAAGSPAAKGASVSSYAVLDELIRRFSDRTRYPKLQRIVLAGHSDGGQMVLRYAILNGVDEQVRRSGIDLSYVVANPSSYLYFTDERPAAGGFAKFDAASCPSFNQYRYGLENIVPYGAGLTASSLLTRFLDRHLTFLWGTRDIDPQQRVLDRSCAAEAQGAYRLARGRNYWDYEQHLVPGASLGHQAAFEVIGVAHNQEGMFSSECGATLLFGVTPADSGKRAACARVPPGAPH